MEREEFQSKLAELGEQAKVKGNCLTKEEVQNFLADMELAEEQYQLIYAYLSARRIRVEGYEPSQTGEEAQEKEQIPLTAEEERFLEQYKSELEYLKRLNEEEMLELFRLAEDRGDGLAKAKLTEQFLPEVLELADGFRGQGLLLGDLVQEGNIGLMLAMETLGMRSEELTQREYLMQEIRTAMEQAIQENRSEKSAGEILAERLNDLRDNIEKLSEELERQVSVEELSVYMDMPVEEIEDLLKLAGETGEDADDTEEGRD